MRSDCNGKENKSDLTIVDVNTQNSWTTSGNIEIIIEQEENETKIETTMTVMRYDEECEFTYGIYNPTDEDIVISALTGNFDPTRLYEKNNVEINNDIIDMLNIEEAAFPTTISANKKAYFYYKIPLDEQQHNTYFFQSPGATYTVSGSDEVRKLYFQLNSYPPIIEKTANDVLDYTRGR